MLPRTPPAPLTSGLESPIIPLGSENSRMGAPLCASPQFWGQCQPGSRVSRGKAWSSLNSADWLLCYYPETGPGAERGRSSWGAPARGVYTHGGTHPSTPIPPNHSAASRSIPGLYCSVAASPWPGVYLVLIYFPPFVEKRCWLGCSPRALFLKRQSW